MKISMFSSLVLACLGIKVQTVTFANLLELESGFHAETPKNCANTGVEDMNKTNRNVNVVSLMHFVRYLGGWHLTQTCPQCLG